MLLAVTLTLLAAAPLAGGRARPPLSAGTGPLDALVALAGTGALGDLADPLLFRLAEGSPDAALREAATWAIARRRLVVGLADDELVLVQHELGALRSARDPAIARLARAHLLRLAAAPDAGPLLAAGPWAEREGRLLVAVFLGTGERSRAELARLAVLVDAFAELPVAWWILRRGDAADAGGATVPPVDFQGPAEPAASELGVLTWPRAWVLRPDGEVAACGVALAELDRAVSAALCADPVPSRREGAQPAMFFERAAGEELYLISLEVGPGSPSASRLVRGRVEWRGPPAPAPEPEDVRIGAGCDVPEGFVPRRRGIELGPEGGIRDVVVMRPGSAIEPDPLPFDAFEMAIRGARFEPRVLLVPAGARVRFENRDECAHVIHLLTRRNPATNSSIAPGGSLGLILERPERVRVRDDVHPWMEGWVVVHDGGPAMRTDESGLFELDGLPAGEQRVVLWHPDPRIGTLTVAVRLGERELRELVVRVRRWR